MPFKTSNNLPVQLMQVKFSRIMHNGLSRFLTFRFLAELTVTSKISCFNGK